MIEFLPLYIEGLQKMWPLWLILFLAITWTGLSEAIDRKWDGREMIEKKTMEEAPGRDKPKRSNY